MCKIQHFSERKIHFFGQFLHEKIDIFDNFRDKKLTFLRHLTFFRAKNPFFERFPEISIFKFFFDKKITFLRQNLEKLRNFGRFLNNFQTPIFKNWQFLTKNLHFSEPKIAFFGRFLRDSLDFQFLHEKIDIFWSKKWEVLTIFGQFWKICNFFDKKSTFFRAKIAFFDVFWERFPWFSIFGRKTYIFKAKNSFFEEIWTIFKDTAYSFQKPNKSHFWHFWSTNSFDLQHLDEKWQILDWCWAFFWHKFKTPLGRPCEMANLETVDVRKSRFWRKSWSQIFLVSAVPWTDSLLL